MNMSKITFQVDSPFLFMETWGVRASIPIHIWSVYIPSLLCFSDFPETENTKTIWSKMMKKNNEKLFLRAMFQKVSYWVQILMRFLLLLIFIRCSFILIVFYVWIELFAWPSVHFTRDLVYVKVYPVRALFVIG